MDFKVNGDSMGPSLHDQIMASGAFLETDGTVGFVCIDGQVIRSGLFFDKFIVDGAQDILQHLIDTGAIARAIAPGEQITITV